MYCCFTAKKHASPLTRLLHERTHNSSMLADEVCGEIWRLAVTSCPVNTKMYAPQQSGLGEGFMPSIRSGTSFTSRPAEVADSHGEARTLAGVVYSYQCCLAASPDSCVLPCACCLQHVSMIVTLAFYKQFCINIALAKSAHSN